MRKMQLLVAAAAAAVSGFGVSWAGSGGPEAGGDAQLAAFDRANPQCQLWTNWQKMCSRTGPGGETICVVDPARRVRPSEPFCSGFSDSPRVRPRAADLSARQAASINRFCSPARASTGPTGAPNEECGLSPARPFNGYRLAARLHPWCGQWSDALTGAPVCNMDGAGGLPSCRALARRGFRNRNGFSCSAPRIPDWCAWPAGLGAGYAGDPSNRTTNENVILTGERQEGFPVRGVYCRRRR